MNRFVAALILALSGFVGFYAGASSMQTKFVERGEIKVIGIEVRTSYTEESTGKGKIAGSWQRFYQESIGAKIPNQSNPGTVLAVYADYESDEKGAYSHLIGAEVSSLQSVPSGMVARTLGPATYAALTSKRGPIPDIIIDLWKQIWALTPEDLNGKHRAFKIDFEVYDQRSQNPKDAQIDIFLSVK
jgi:predicted transcriptional regulator YdeE